MVKIIGTALRKSKEGKSFVALELQGSLEFVQSQESGKFYATAKRCSVTSTFDEETAKSLIGTSLPGSIVRAETDAYNFTIPETGEVISLAHTYQYVPEEKQEFHVIPSRMESVSLAV